MDEISKAAAMRKSYFMKKIIAYPNQLLNDAEIDKYTHNIYFDEYRFFENALTLSRFHYDYALTGLQEKTDQRLWITLSDSTLPSAYYYILNNAFSKYLQHEISISNDFHVANFFYSHLSWYPANTYIQLQLA